MAHYLATLGTARATYIKALANDDYKMYHATQETGSPEHANGSLFGNVTWVGETFDEAWANFFKYGVSGAPH